jgi:predicted ATP-dependent endonuclease of OLD family
MELFQVEISGFKKFKEKATLKTRGKLLAILGPNEAGKSSLLRALNLLDVNNPYDLHERSRGADDKYPIIKATYLLSQEDRDAANINVGVWYEITKYADGERKWAIRPNPPDRSYAHRLKLVAQVTKLSKAAVAFIAETDESLITDTNTLLGHIFRNEKELSAEGQQQLAEIASRWHSVMESGTLQRIKELCANLDAAIKVETAKSQRVSAGEALWDRLPGFVLFGADDRDLKPSYLWTELSAALPKALSNLAKVAELDLPKLIAVATTNPNDPEFDTLMEQANIALERNFQAAWKQSKVSVVLAHREQSLLVQVYNNDRSRTDFGQRSDGLRQFVALRCFTASRETDNFILLIDEVEQHLHYDAQADLVQMLAGQTVASKVIYTTHSLGCLPEDLGNGVRLIIPTAPDSDWSKIENKFWLIRDKEEAAFSPILMGMGASTMAFFPTRAAILVEGPSDSILLPTMFREALGGPAIGVQFVHGLSENGHISLPLLNSTGTRVCYLLDNDGGGRKLAEQLIERNVDRGRVFHLPVSRGDAELEDFLDPALLAEAASSLAKHHLGVEQLVSAPDLPRFGKWDFIVHACEEAGLKALKKVPVAYEILELLDTAPSRHLVDRRHSASFKSFAEKIITKVRERPL